jgi:hypothetical protein
MKSAVKETASRLATMDEEGVCVSEVPAAVSARAEAAGASWWLEALPNPAKEWSGPGRSGWANPLATPPRRTLPRQ